MSLLTLFDSGDSSRFEFQFNERLTTLPPSLTRLGATYTRNSLKNVLQDGALVSLAANQFGTSYDPVTSLYAYMPEPAATNLLTYSSDISNAAWTKGGVSLGSPSTICGVTAYPLVEDLALSAHRIISSNIALTSGQAYAFQCIVKANGRDYIHFRVNNSGGDFVSIVVKISTATVVTTAVGTATASVIGNNGEVLIKCYGTSLATANTGVYIATLDDATINNHTGDGVSGFYVTAIQVETGTRATSYILTTSGTAARAADVLSIPTANIAGFNDIAYTMFVDGRQDVLTTNTWFSELSDGTTNNVSYINIDGVSSQGCGTRVSNVSQDSAQALTARITRSKIAYSVAANNFMRSGNGVARDTDTSGTVPTVTLFTVGCRGALSSQFNGYIFSATLYTRALTRAQLNAITL